MAGKAPNATKTPEPRVFIYNGAELEDPDPAMADKDVKNQYAQAYPELTTANLEVKFEDRGGVKTKVINFKKAAGTKG
ncbi:PRTRC system protein C [bacterium]|nr:MAG: PRTRC system protein C [bacterium]